MNYKNILIVSKPQSDLLTQSIIRHITNFAEKNNINIITEDFDNGEKTLIISIGGDGTMLGSMRISVKFKNSVVLGINTGTLGFLTEEIPNRLISFLEDVFYSHDFSFIEERMILEGSLSFNDNTYIAANEFVFSSSVDVPLKTKVFINDNFVNEHLGSGVLVSSATGSTAMTLSAGGAIVNPNTNIMQIVPLLPHTLSSRPIITTWRDTITIKSNLSSRVPSIKIHADGKEIAFFEEHTYNKEVSITIKKHHKSVKIWRPKDWNFFEVLSKKMGW